MKASAATLPICLWAAAAAGIASAAPAPLEAESRPTAIEDQSIPGWDEFVDSLRQAAPQALQKLTPGQRADPQYRAEVGRLLHEALAARSLDAISADPQHPQFLPTLNPTFNVFQPNADTIYKRTEIEPGGTYRLVGVRGSATIAKIGQQVMVPMEQRSTPAATKGYFDLNSLPVDKEGRYELIISPERPAGYKGAWWKLEPDVNSLGLRQVASDWHREVDPSIAIERLDRPVVRPRPSVADLDQRLRTLGSRTAATALTFIDHAQQLRHDGYENRLREFDTSQLAGLTGQFYYEGAYRLKDDEALILSSPVPAGCSYYSTILTNDIYETTDWVNNHSSLNDAQSQVDPDGVLRIVISARDPGVANWLDTAGYPTGVIQGRWTDCKAQPIPTLMLVRLADVAARLPASTAHVTPAQREAKTRARRLDFLLRRQW